MLRQDFTTNSLLRVTTKNEIIKFNLGRELKDYKLRLDEISDNINNSSFEIKRISTTKVKGKNVYYTDFPEEHYCIKKISSDIKRLYKIKTTNRDDISEQVLRILETSSSYGIIRIDIKSFYESINYIELLDKLKNDKLLSSKSLSFLQEILLLNNPGLPRGLSISPVLSEIFMRRIDSKIKEIPGVYYYSRYVDDIFIFSTKDYSNIQKELESILKTRNLETNKKTFVSNVGFAPNNENSDISFDYLGYKYIITPKCFNGKRVVNVSLSSDKVRKIKTRIVHALLDRSFTKNATSYHKDLLINRINILSGNYPISNKKGRNGTLKGGIFYSNRLVNCSGIFEEFNDFLKKSLFSRKKNFFGNAVNKIPLQEKNDIKNICFKSGFVQKKYLPVSDKEMKLIKQCWEHKNHKKKS
ncbi:RNA-directed DNA polymerase [Vibrio splendidus]|uniref:antiviral reverse transcriptase Drt3a n=1 Tax=Vibrio splendidus TaxID=29497 RepID=UPI001FB50C25|nr:antiviral reverse transcriptase Drt3a [Vibrio splendidus]UOE82694.1 RNA-directed DNA polymerase [Vibrio splendidus]